MSVVKNHGSGTVEIMSKIFEYGVFTLTTKLKFRGFWLENAVCIRLIRARLIHPNVLSCKTKTSEFIMSIKFRISIEGNSVTVAVNPGNNIYIYISVSR